MKQEKINSYEVMWLFVCFDLPVTTQRQQSIANRFRNLLKKDGFTMMQYSVYTRHCASRESARVHIKRVKNIIPAKGHVSILQVTDKQYGQIINLRGKKSEALETPAPQFELF